MTRTLDEILAQFRETGSVTLLPAGEVALLVAEVERLRALNSTEPAPKRSPAA